MKALVSIGISTLAVVRIGTGSITDTFSCTVDLNGFWTYPFVTQRAVTSAQSAAQGELLAGQRTDRITEYVEVIVRGFGVSSVKRDTRSFKMNIIFQHRIVVIGITGGVTQEC